MSRWTHTYANVIAIAISNYLKSLDPVAKVRYMAKTEVMGLKQDDDPYNLATKFVNDMSLLPLIEFGHIFCSGLAYIRRNSFSVEKSGSVQLF